MISFFFSLLDLELRMDALSLDHNDDKNVNNIEIDRMCPVYNFMSKH